MIKMDFAFCLLLCVWNIVVFACCVKNIPLRLLFAMASLSPNNNEKMYCKLMLAGFFMINGKSIKGKVASIVTSGAICSANNSYLDYSD